MSARFDTRGLRQFADHLEQSGQRAPQLARAKVRSGGQFLLNNITRRARGRPGPRAITERYVGSWRLQTDTDRAGNARATAGTDHAAGFRLERGFHGTDSLGRHFEAPGYPHVAPGTRATERPFFDLVEQMPDELL